MIIQKDKLRVVVKVGSSSLTNKQGDLETEKIKKIIAETAILASMDYEVILVSSGAVAAGYRQLGYLRPPKSLGEKQAAASIGQGILIESYSRMFSEKGLNAAQILITRDDFLDEQKYDNIRNTINILLKNNVIPIINENDSVSSEPIKFGDNDSLAARVAGLLDVDKLLILSDIDGLFDKNPEKNDDAKLLEQLTEITPEIEAMATDSTSGVGTGGMKTKIEAMKISISAGIESFIGNASRPNIIIDAINGKAKGTYFTPKKQQQALSHRKKWIAFNSHTEGTIMIKASTVNATSRQFTLNDIVKVIGNFEEQAIIKIIDTEGHVLGKGRVNYGSGMLNDFLGKKKSLDGANTKVIVNVDEYVCCKEIPILVGV